ncbi:hypothetical protein Tco_0815286 [Tanacetum coccineum]
MLGRGDANPDSNVIKGTFILNNHYAFILFDSGVDRSFVSTTFSTLLNITPDTLDLSYAVELADGRISETNTVLRGYAMPNELGVSLILNSLNKDYDQFIQNYNMHSLGKTIAELHAMLKLHEKGIPKKAETHAVLTIREGKIQKNKRKPRGAKGKDKGKNKLAYSPKPKISPPPKRDNSEKDSKCIDKLQRDGILQSTHDESLEKSKSCIIGKMARKPFPHQVERANGPLGYPKETMGYYFYYPPENKIFFARNAEFFENCLIVQEASRSHELIKMSRSDEELELIQEEDTQPSENTSKEHNEVVPIEYELGDLNEPPNYKAALSDPEYDKC